VAASVGRSFVCGAVCCAPRGFTRLDCHGGCRRAGMGWGGMARQAGASGGGGGGGGASPSLFRPPPPSDVFLLLRQLLVHESSVITGTDETARSHGHSSARMAGVFAAEARVKALVLTHFSSGEVTTWRDSVLEAFDSADCVEPWAEHTSSTAPYACPDVVDPSAVMRQAAVLAAAAGVKAVVPARDFMSFPIPTGGL
jgi:hypothetical protein